MNVYSFSFRQVRCGDRLVKNPENLCPRMNQVNYAGLIGSGVLRGNVILSMKAGVLKMEDE